MKKFLIICCVFVFITGLKKASAQYFPNPNIGTEFHLDDMNGGYVDAEIYFANGATVGPADGVHQKVVFAAIEIIGIDANNNEIPIISTSTTNSGLSYMWAIGPNSNPAIVTIQVILLAQYNDPVNGDYEEEMYYEYTPGNGAYVYRPGI